MFDRRAPILLLATIPFLAHSTFAAPTTAPATNESFPSQLELRRKIVEAAPPNAPDPLAQAPEPEPAPTTLPSQAAAKPASEKDVLRWFNDLAASDAAVRERAYDAMLGMTRPDLPALRRIVERARPVAPSQRGVLREIVTHVYLSGEPYPAEPKSGFLGLLMPTLDSVEVRRDDKGDDDDAGAPAPPPPGIININDVIGGPLLQIAASTGVPIEYRIPGFCAFKSLREGDVVLGIVRPVPRRLREWGELSPTIMRFRAGEMVTFQVLRQGKVLEVPIKLDARPLVPNENAWMTEILPAREAAADDYWAQNFAPLVEDHASASVPAPDQHASAE
jgi:hypothetical protein